MAERPGLPSAWATTLAAQGQREDLAWEPSVLASLVKGEGAAQRLFAAALQVKLAEAQGHTRLALAGPDAPAWLGGFGPAPDAAALESDPELGGFVAGADGMAPLIAGRGWLATGRAVDQERRLSSGLLARAAWRDAAPDLDLPAHFNEEQRAAVRLAAASRLCVITGGPGTGKTSIVAALLAALPDLEAVLAAPTGKAAQRMGQALPDRAPQTLHRLLGWHPRRGWRHHAGNPLTQDLVVVDEASMVDQELMARLVDALRPEARLVLLGDADQLPSVGGGAVLRDLVSALPDSVARLERSYRMDASDPAGGAILACARRVRRGEAGAEDLPIHAEAGALAGQGAELLRPEGLPGFLQAWRGRIEALAGYESLIHAEHAPGPGGFDAASVARLDALRDHHARFRLLALLQEGPRGASALNEALHAMAWTLNGRGLQRDLPFYLGEPVMMLRNDYGRGLFNGDEGFIVKVRRGGEAHREAVFWREGRPVAFPAAALQGDLALAYALTVHKAQGSEFDAIAILLPEGDHPLLTRQNLYTALTRARKHALLIGDPDLPPLAARKPERRATGLAELLERRIKDR
ncbi:MAG TPA: AAA family ATPase [Holophagaceae bacterium]|nr:AAA family ATPase [Holophagaceae bacterium]